MKRLLVSCFGLGRLPLAPGTAGSVPPVIIFGLLCHFGASAIATSSVMAILALVSSVVCVAFADASIAATGNNDPGEVVADEFAGQAVTFLAISLLPISRIYTVSIIGFILFRLFDITKPWPIKKFERLPKGWGILCDDLMAGVYAGVVLLIAKSLLIPRFLG